MNYQKIVMKFGEKVSNSNKKGFDNKPVYN